ncbi:Protein PLASTID MOVEMENT IMPAIRED 1-RELATED like [Actinidia chinensis var. chinensis]|uniref:Protein PLASTID MOVEMENT IMPAIRED 1-RELATED like n=1 Tax=Actinidia chinensis var. chinensis TaxID=1590841 RepID=A0A2R6R270_ACTCC|nr:Protein PLASTID MOVEMENT IMPAIRED 1-RELATED like [Actinidia chinensis var. chinensis]
MRCDSTDEFYGDLKDHFVMENGRCEGNGIGEIEGFESVEYNLSVSESGDFDSSLDINEFFKQENYTENRSSYKAVKMVKSLSLDDLTESVANDFLKMVAVEKIPLDLSADSEPESPRELLLRQFEEEGLASIDIFLNLDGEEEPVDFSVADPTAECGDLSDNFDLPLLIRAAEEDEDPEMVGQSLRSKRNAELLENLETEFLMKEWGLNEDVFQNSPRTTSGGFGSPIYFPAQEPLEFPPLGEGLGPIVQTKDGGFLRSMNPSLFKKAKNGGCLIMQVSTPVVLPVAMGSSIMEILQHWASVGFEKMSLQVNKLMPMEDINGKMMQQVAWEVGSRLGAPERVLQQEDGQISIATKMKIKEYPIDWGCKDLTLSSVRDDIDSDYVSLEDLAPLAMDKIEALSIEGLRIQSGMSDEEAPSRIRPQSIGKTSAFLGKSVKIGGSFIWEGAAELQLSGVKDNCDDDDVVIDELISLSITLDEWMRLDAFGDEEEIDERTSKILAAHVADIDFISSMLTRGTKWDKSTGRSCGLLGNNFTVALRVQLRDPLRDYETVGAPMLALVQVERVFVDLKPKVYQRVSQRRDGNEEDDLFEEIVDGVKAEENWEERIEECIPWFKITEVHLVGFNTELGKKQQWGTTTQEQSGTRWLLATGMGRNTNHLYLKSNAIVKSSSQGVHKMQLGDTMWSISSHVHGPRAKWKELATLNLHIRNPDVIFQT